MKTISPIITIIFTTFINNLIAQISFQKTYGGPGTDYAQSVQQTNDGGYIISGETNSFGAGNFDIYLIKTDTYGDTLWTRTYGGISEDWERSVQQTSDGGYIISGETQNSTLGYSDLYLIKTDVNGDTLWTKKFGGAGWDMGNSIQQTIDGGYIVAGETSSFGAGNDDVYLIKINSIGDTLWTKTFGGLNDDRANSIQQTSDSGYIILGETASFGAGGLDFYLIKTNVNGDSIWTKTYGGVNNEGDVGSETVQQTFDGGYILSGTTYSYGAGQHDVYLIKTNNMGDTLWTKTFGGLDNDWGSSAQQTADSGYIITGGTVSFGGADCNVYLIRTNSVGDTLWTQTLGGLNFSYGISVNQTSDQGFIIGGAIDVLANDTVDVFLIKTNSNGIIGIDETSPKTFAISIYPNPSSGKTVISSNKGFINSIEIYNVVGKLIYSDNILNKNKSNEIDLSKAGNGIYFAIIYVREFIYSEKIIIE